MNTRISEPTGLFSSINFSVEHSEKLGQQEVLQTVSLCTAECVFDEQGSSTDCRVACAERMAHAILFKEKVPVAIGYSDTVSFKGFFFAQRKGLSEKNITDSTTNKEIQTKIAKAVTVCENSCLREAGKGFCAPLCAEIVPATQLDRFLQTEKNTCFNPDFREHISMWSTPNPTCSANCTTLSQNVILRKIIYFDTTVEPVAQQEVSPHPTYQSVPCPEPFGCSILESPAVLALGVAKNFARNEVLPAVALYSSTHLAISSLLHIQQERTTMGKVKDIALATLSTAAAVSTVMTFGSTAIAGAVSFEVIRRAILFLT